MLFLYFVFQIVHVGCFRGNKGIESELCAEAEAGNEAVEGGLAVDGSPGIDILEEAFLFLAGETIAHPKTIYNKTPARAMRVKKYPGCKSIRCNRGLIVFIQFLFSFSEY